MTPGDGSADTGPEVTWSARTTADREARTAAGGALDAAPVTVPGLDERIAADLAGDKPAEELIADLAADQAVVVEEAPLEGSGVAAEERHDDDAALVDVIRHAAAEDGIDLPAADAPVEGDETVVEGAPGDGTATPVEGVPDDGDGTETPPAVVAADGADAPGDGTEAPDADGADTPAEAAPADGAAAPGDGTETPGDGTETPPAVVVAPATPEVPTTPPAAPERKGLYTRARDRLKERFLARRAEPGVAIDAPEGTVAAAEGAGTDAAEGTDAAAVEPAPREIPVEQTRLQELQDRVDGGKALKGKDLAEWHDLKSKKDRHDVLQAKLDNGDNISPDEMTELGKLQETWGENGEDIDGNLAKTVEHLNFDDPASFATFADALNKYAEKRTGERIHPEIEGAMQRAITELFEKPEAKLTGPEERAIKKVKELCQGMRRDIMSIITYERRVKAMEKAQSKLVDEIEKQEAKAKGDIGPDDRKKQAELFKLTNMYQQLTAMNANFILIEVQAQDVDWNLRYKQRQIRRQLGLAGVGGAWNDTALFTDALFLTLRKVNRQFTSMMQHAPLARPLARSGMEVSSRI